MATLKQRLHRKNSSGTYDTIHLETGADCITGTLAITNGGTGATTAANARTNLGVEEALEAKISHTDEFTAEMQDLHGNARGLLVTVPSAAGPDIASINAPPDVNWGTCLSLQAGSIRTLMLIDYSGLWIQYYNSQSWSTWKKILSTDSTGILDVSHGGTGVTSLAELKSQLGIVEIVQTVSIELGHYSYEGASTYTLKQSVKYIKVVGGYRRPNNADTIAMPEVTITAGSNAVCASYYVQSGTVAWGEYSVVVALGSDGKTISVSGGITHNGARPSVLDTGNVTAYA